MKKYLRLISFLVLVTIGMSMPSYAQSSPAARAGAGANSRIGYAVGTNSGENASGFYTPAPTATPDCVQQYLEQATNSQASTQQKQALMNCLDTTMCSIVEALAQTILGSTTGGKAREPQRQACNFMVSLACPSACKTRWTSFLSSTATRGNKSNPCSANCSLGFFICEEGIDIFDELRIQCKAGDQGFPELWELLGLRL